MPRLLVSWSCVLTVVAGSLSAQSERDPGERLPASALGAGVVESMAKVQRRHDALPPQPRTVAKEHDGRPGRWLVPARSAAVAQAHSGERYAINEWGDAAMGITFPHRVDVDGAWFAAQGGRGSATTAVRALGYRDGVEVAHSEWLESIGAAPKWLAMDLQDVDRLVVEAQPVRGGAGWFAMDDLTFGDVGAAARIVVDFEDIAWRSVLTDSGYRGLCWERGTGRFEQDAKSAEQDGVRIVPAPKQPPQPQLRAAPPTGNPTTSSAVVFGTAPHVTWSVNGPQIFDPGSAVIPPDSSGAVGPNHFLSLVNSNFSVYRKDTRARIVNVALDAFFALPGGVGIGDVRAVFDPHGQRFVISAMTGPYGWICGMADSARQLHLGGVVAPFFLTWHLVSGASVAVRMPPMNSPSTITKRSTMQDILQAFPSAQRALFRRYHIGGCNSCGYQPDDVLEDVASRHNISDADEIVAFLHSADESDRRIQVQAKDVAAALRGPNPPKLLDVRSPDEWAIAHLAGAQLVDETLANQIMQWPKQTPIVLYCHTGVRSLDAASYLAGHGFTDVRSMVGGIDVWSREIDNTVPRYEVARDPASGRPTLRMLRSSMA